MKKHTVYIIIVAVIMFLMAWSRFYVLQLTMIINVYEKEYETEYNKYIKLQLEKDRLLSLDRLEHYGRDTLQMVFPSGADYAP